jgi:hypothetical protein
MTRFIYTEYLISTLGSRGTVALTAPLIINDRVLVRDPIYETEH